MSAIGGEPLPPRRPPAERRHLLTYHGRPPLRAVESGPGSGVMPGAPLSRAQERQPRRPLGQVLLGWGWAPLLLVAGAFSLMGCAHPRRRAMSGPRRPNPGDSVLGRRRGSILRATAGNGNPLGPPPRTVAWRPWAAWQPPFLPPRSVTAKVTQPQRRQRPRNHARRHRIVALAVGAAAACTWPRPRPPRTLQLRTRPAALGLPRPTVLRGSAPN